MTHIISCAVVNEQCQLKDVSINMDIFWCFYEVKKANGILTCLRKENMMGEISIVDKPKRKISFLYKAKMWF